MHCEFIEKLQLEKGFKQEIYAVEKLIEHEERMKRREKDLVFE